LTDNYTQNNNLSFQTSRPLWEGVTLDLSWKVGWIYNDNRTSSADSTGIPYDMNSTVTGSISRSYISLPSFLMFKLFNTNLENVNKKYTELKQADERDSVTSNAAKLSQAFEEGLEAFPWLTKILGPIAPRVNWSIRWGGLENISFFKSFATSISLDHSYLSTYAQSWKMIQGGDKEITSQSVVYGFTPLIGLNISFKDIAKGKLNATFRYNTTTTYDLTPSSSTVGENSKSDIAISASFSRQGFEIPFFGLSLMNNIDISANCSFSHISILRYNFNEFKSDGIPIDGTSTTTIEPRIRYTLSERVTASLYYRYSKVTPDEGGSKTLGSTTNEGGVDFNIAIK
jgi:cell surface protein SprA